MASALEQFVNNVRTLSKQGTIDFGYCESVELNLKTQKQKAKEQTLKHSQRRQLLSKKKCLDFLNSLRVFNNNKSLDNI